ncbi:aconitase family protein, partial [Bacillus haynesii]
KNLRTDPGAVYDRTIVMDGSAISPMVTWGIHPGMVLPVDETIPGPEA